MKLTKKQLIALAKAAGVYVACGPLGSPEHVRMDNGDCLGLSTHSVLWRWAPWLYDSHAVCIAVGMGINVAYTPEGGIDTWEAYARPCMGVGPTYREAVIAAALAKIEGEGKQ